MNKQYPHLTKRGNTYQVRRRIPASLAAAYPQNKKEITFSLQTSDLKEAQKRLRSALVKIDQEFEATAKRLAAPRPDAIPVTTLGELSDGQIQFLAQSWTREVLLTDQYVRSAGLGEEEYDAMGVQLQTQRAELGKLLAQGRIEPILPAFRTFCHLNGIDDRLPPENLRKAGYQFLRAVVAGLDHRLKLHEGEVVNVDFVAPRNPEPLIPAKYVGPSWDEIFEVWTNFVEDRPKSSIISYQTPWGQLQRFALDSNVLGPADVSTKLVSAFVDHMKTKLGLTVKTINGRLGKLREIYRVAKGRQILENNPTLDVIGFKESARSKALRKRLPFTNADLQLVFGSEVFTNGARSTGQSGEACYWIPLIMHYTGARPEEIAGLTTTDIAQHSSLGWYFDITDLASNEDAGLFDDETPQAKKTPKRTLKNVVSRRKIPVAQELIELGFLNYLEFIKKQGKTMVFPDLTRDFHGKFSGAFGKWFGRYKKKLGFNGPQKTLYSLRHNMKDLMDQAQIPTKYLKRILGHASGDGTITDGYGTGVPFEVIHEHFGKIRFPKIPAVAWRLGEMNQGQK